MASSGQSTPKGKIGGSLLSQSSFALKGTPSRFRSKKKKLPQLALIKRNQYHVYDIDGIERTPKLLYDPEYQVLEEWQPTVLDYVDAELGSSGSQINLSRSFAQGPNPLSYGSRAQNSVSLQMSFTNIANVDSYKDPTKTLEADVFSEGRSDDIFSETAPSAFRLRDLPSREFCPPHSKIPLLATETESFTLFSMESVVQPANTDYAAVLQAENEYYESITVGKGRYTRKVNTSEQQTPDHISTTQISLCPRVPTKNSSTWITAWKLYDELMGHAEEKKDYLSIPTDEQWAQINEEERFIGQCIIMERILGSQTFRKIQLKYTKSIQLDPLDLDVQFSYSAETLWIYETGATQKKPVTAIAINTLNPQIIAVGHGKFFYSEPDRGYICIWCVKNPKHPERIYKFHSSVKCLDFAVWTPNLLAAGFLNGELLILDVSSSEKKIIFAKDSVECETYEKIIFTKWWICLDLYGKKEERLMITTGDGRIIQFRRRRNNLVPFQMMRLSKLEGNVKGIEYLRKCEVEEIPMLRFPSARCVVRYPLDDQFYLVSGDDGTVHKCSTNFFTQHVESFVAHSGPVYGLKFSPFCSKIFLTCGADGAVRLWAWDIFEPLITLTMGPDAVEDAAWSPRNSTIIASISDIYLHLWDLRRKTHHPASTIIHPTKAKFISLHFTETGNNIMLGDAEGNLYVMALYGMPFEEQFKEDVLAAAIEKELIVKPKLLKLLKKSGPPFSS